MSYFSDKIPVTIITGFLGSGKTTLLNKLLKTGQMENCLVLINEYGDVAIDHLITQQLTDDVVLLESGCVCCTLRGEFQVTLLDLYAQRDAEVIPPFDHIIIETTGLADPAPIAQILMTDKLVMEEFYLNGVICLVDSVLGQKTSDSNAIWQKQVLLADLLVLTKQDLTDDKSLAVLKSQLKKLNSHARQLQAAQICGPEDLYIASEHPSTSRQLSLGFTDLQGHNQDFDKARCTEIEQPEDDCHCSHEHHHDCDCHHNHVQTGHDADISSLTIYPEQVNSVESLLETLEDLVFDTGDNILRIKGIVRIEGNPNPVLVHGVQNIFHPFVELDEWPDNDQTNRLVFIGHNLDRQIIEKSLSVFSSAEIHLA